MWPVSPPKVDAATSYKLCLSRIADPHLRRRLLRSAHMIALSERAYKSRARAKTLHLMATSIAVGKVSATEMTQLYDWRMAKKGSPGRPIYDRIKLLPKGDLCPLCGQRDVSTLDHVLPKAHYPDLAVTPINLVGACMECNKAKSAGISASASEVPLHPYFDDISAHQWLTATVLHKKNAPIVFDITPPAIWDKTTESRAKKQFHQLQLSVLYSNQAAREVSSIRSNLQRHFDSGGASAVQVELMHQWRSRLASSINSWRTAMYEAASKDTWFHGGGFALT